MYTKTYFVHKPLLEQCFDEAWFTYTGMHVYIKHNQIINESAATNQLFYKKKCHLISHIK